MALNSKHNIKQIIKDIDDSLERFIKEGKYKDVLLSMGNLAHYSLNNQIYIISQMPSARTVYGIRKWNSLGRHVKKGETSIKILVPIRKKKEKDESQTERYYVASFKVGYVFDISQTDGKDLNVFRFDETKIVENKGMIINGLVKAANSIGYSVSYIEKENMNLGCYGICNHQTKEIKIVKNLSDLQQISTLVHECGHAFAHSKYREDFEGLAQNEKKEIKEVEAESISCIVCTYLGLDTQNFNFSYITGWAGGDISKFRRNIEVISRHANTLIKEIEKSMEGTESSKTDQS